MVSQDLYAQLHGVVVKRRGKAVLGPLDLDLSGGAQQKLALARALIRGPDTVFLDEPCSNLDGRSTREIEEILRDASAAGARIIMSTHDLGQARRLADRVLFLNKGQLEEQGPADRFFAAPKSPGAIAFLNGDIIE